jgi:hypothetical protein
VQIDPHPTFGQSQVRNFVGESNPAHHQIHEEKHFSHEQ